MTQKKCPFPKKLYVQFYTDSNTKVTDNQMVAMVTQEETVDADLGSTVAGKDVGVYVLGGRVKLTVHKQIIETKR